MPGVMKVVRDGSFLAVIAEREFQAVKAMDALAARQRWDESQTLPEPGAISIDWLRSAPSQDHVVREERTAQSRSRADARGRVPASLPDARLDRAVLRGGACSRTAR